MGNCNDFETEQLPTLGKLGPVADLYPFLHSDAYSTQFGSKTIKVYLTISQNKYGNNFLEPATTVFSSRTGTTNSSRRFNEVLSDKKYYTNHLGYQKSSLRNSATQQLLQNSAYLHWKWTIYYTKTTLVGHSLGPTTRSTVIT